MCMQTPCFLKHTRLWPLRVFDTWAKTNGCFCNDMPTCWARRSSWLYKAFTYRSYHTSEQLPFWKSPVWSLTEKLTNVGLDLLFFDVYFKFPFAVTTVIHNKADVYQVISSHLILNYLVLPSWLWPQVKGLLKLQYRREEMKTVDMFYYSKLEN